MPELEMLGPDTVMDFIAAPKAHLMISKKDCPACHEWTEELSTWLASGEAPSDVRFGKLILDQRGLIDFKKASPWLAEVDTLPFNVLYEGSEKVKDFAGSGVDRLANRLKRLGAQDS